MPLTDAPIPPAKAGPKPTKLTDEKGLFLLVAPSGGIKASRQTDPYSAIQRSVSAPSIPDNRSAAKTQLERAKYGPAAFCLIRDRADGSFSSVGNAGDFMR